MVAAASPLFDCVPIPKTSEPCAVCALPAASGGSWMTLPLLSGKAATGFDTCCAMVAGSGEHPASGQLKYMLCGAVVQAVPQSCNKTPMPTIAFAWSAVTELSAPPVVWLVQAAGAAGKFD